MTYPEWPAALPHAQATGDGTGPMFRDPLTSEMESGDVRIRRRPGDDVARKSFNFRFNTEQTAVWGGFVRDTLANGTKRFTMPVSVDGLACESRLVQIIGAPSYNGRTGVRRLFSFDAWVFPASMTEAGGATADFSIAENSQIIPLFF